MERSELHLAGVMPTGGHGCWSEPPPSLPQGTQHPSTPAPSTQNPSTQSVHSPQTAAPGAHPALLKGTVQPQHVPLCAESLLIQLQSSITEEINVGGNKGQTQRSKAGVGSRRYMLTASRLAPQGFPRAVIYHDIYYFCHGTRTRSPLQYRSFYFAGLCAG